MNWTKWIRQTHRWLSIFFTLVVIANGIAVGLGKYRGWMGALALAPFALIFFTGVYLFALPYIRGGAAGEPRQFKWRNGSVGTRRAADRASNARLVLSL